jgi:hypothetical protein
MHFRNTLSILAFASSVFISTHASAYMGYYAGVPNCEMGGAGTLSKEDKEMALADKARYKFLEKKLGMIEREMKALAREQGLRGDSEEIVEYVNARMNKVKRAIGADTKLYNIFQQSYTQNWSCEVVGEGKRESSYDLDCGPRPVACDVYVSNEVDTRIQARLAQLAQNYPDDQVECGIDTALPGTPAGLKRLCPTSATKISVNSLEAEMKAYSPVEDPTKYSRVCSRPDQVCRVGAARENYEACNTAMSEINQDLAQKSKEYNIVLAELESLGEDLSGVDFYTEGSYCYECQQSGNRRFVDDRSGFRRAFDTVMPILGAAGAAYGAYSLNNEAIDRATNLGFTTNPAPSFLSYGWPMIMNGVYGGIASGIGAGMFQCGNTMGGAFPGGPNGMLGPFGMNGMMGQNSAFGYPFGQSPYGFNGYGGGPYMPGLVGGYGAGPWGVGGNIGYGVPLQNILGFPGGGAGIAGVPGFPGGGYGVAGIPGGYGVPGFPGGGYGAAGIPGGYGVPGFPGGGYGAAGIPGGYGVPGFPGGYGAAGLYSVPGAAGIAGIPGVAGVAGGYGIAGIPGVAGIAGAAGMYGVAGLYGSIGSQQGLLYQQQLIQQQMQQYQIQMQMLQQYQEYEANRARVRTQLQQQLYNLQIQLQQLEYGGAHGVGVGTFGTTFGTTGVGQGIYPPPTGVYTPGGNPAR